ncbi:hypothetical protein H1C71_021240 [Ictidomys tridecemlineatus]|nr:hypothetical protein H1C71_021240 [Ictidomys tridecemlineatus]
MLLGTCPSAGLYPGSCSPPVFPPTGDGRPMLPESSVSVVHGEPQPGRSRKACPPVHDPRTNTTRKQAAGWGWFFTYLLCFKSHFNVGYFPEWSNNFERAT